MRSLGVLLGLAAVIVCASSVGAATINVGPTRTYTTVQQGVDAAVSGDTILIDPGTYVGTACTALFNSAVASNLTIKGNGGQPLLDMGPDHSVSKWGKGIFDVEAGSSDLTFENLAFTNAAARDVAPYNDTSHNGAAIRWSGGGNFTMRNCLVYNCEDGILVTSNIAGTTVLLERCVFHDDGYPGSTNGTHNIYIGTPSGSQGVSSFTMQYCWSYNCRMAYDVKSNAAVTKLLYNRLGDEITSAPNAWGGGNGVVDIPKGGLTHIIGNMITNGYNATDGRLIKYGEEGLATGFSANMYVLYNTFNGQRNNTNTALTIATGLPPIWAADNIFFCTNSSDLFISGALKNISMGATNVRTYDLNVSGAVSNHTLPIINPGSQWTDTVANAGAANFTLDYHLTAEAVNHNATYYIPATVPGTISWLPATGDGFSLIPDKEFYNTPANGPALGFVARPTATEMGAYSFPTVNPTNAAPVVDAGANQTITLPAKAQLVPTVSDDGLPMPTGTLTYTWSKVSGPGTVSFSPSNSLPSVDASFTAGGTYVLQLQVSDGSSSSSDTVTITASSGVANLTASSVDNAVAGKKTLWRTKKNIVRLTFDANITAPTAGQVLIQEMLAGAGNYGADLSSNFTFTVENDASNNPRILKILDNSTSGVLVNKTWYAVRNTGGWTAAASFEKQTPVLVGDYDGNGVLSAAGDVNPIVAKLSSPSVAPNDADRRDLDGNMVISAAADVNPAVAGLASPTLPAKPAGH